MCNVEIGIGGKRWRLKEIETVCVCVCVVESVNERCEVAGGGRGGRG
jgi:hypothetical protein